MGTIAAHKPCGFQKYWSSESTLWDKKPAKIAILGAFLTGNPQVWADLGQIWHLTTINAVVRPCGTKNENSHFNTARNTGSFLSVFTMQDKNTNTSIQQSDSLHSIKHIRQSIVHC